MLPLKREILVLGVPDLEKFAKGEKGSPSDQVRVLDLCLKHGLVKVDKDLIDELWHAVELNVSDEDRPAIKRAWNQIVGRRLVEAAT